MDSDSDEYKALMTEPEYSTEDPAEGGPEESDASTCRVSRTDVENISETEYDTTVKADTDNDSESFAYEHGDPTNLTDYQYRPPRSDFDNDNEDDEPRMEDQPWFNALRAKGINACKMPDPVKEYQSAYMMGDPVFSVPAWNEAFAYLRYTIAPKKKQRQQLWNFKVNTKRRYRLDPDTGALQQRRRGDETKASERKPNSAGYARKYFTDATPWRTCLTDEEAKLIVSATHEEAGHNGMHPLERLVGSDYVVRNLRDLCRAATGTNCPICTSYAPAPKKPLQCIVTRYPLELVMYDLTSFGVLTKDGYRYIMVVIDHFTKFIWTKAFKRKTKGPIADWLRTMFNSDIPVPTRFHCDNGKEFLNEAMDKAMEDLNKPNVSHGLPRHPQTQGAVERVNATLKTLLMKLCIENGYVLDENSTKKRNTFEWHEFLPQATQMYNDSPIMDLYGGLCPYQLLHLRSMHI